MTAVVAAIWVYKAFEENARISEVVSLSVCQQRNYIPLCKLMRIPDNLDVCSNTEST